MSQPPQWQPPSGSGGRPASGDQPAHGGADAAGAPARRGRNRRNAAVAVALLVGTVVAVILVADHHPMTTATIDSGTSTSTSIPPSPAPSTAPSPSSSPSSSPPSTASPSAGPSSAPSGAGDAAAFLAQLPGDFLDCAAVRPIGDGDVAAATCRSAATQPDLVQAIFHRYPDQATLDSVFESQAAERGMSPFPDGLDCSTANGYGRWSHADQTRGGQLACQVTGEGEVLLVWTDDEFLTEGTVRTPGDSRAEMAALYDWWTSHRDFRP
jgi:hypothetical protein